MDKTELMKDVLKVTGIAPIIAYAEPGQAVPAAKALVAGGLPVVEVLMRNEHAMGNLERIARDVPEIVAGAGTIITLDQAKAAIDHGAQFIIMPGIGRQVVEYCIDKKIPVIPNCITPGEMTMRWNTASIWSSFSRSTSSAVWRRSMNIPAHTPCSTSS